MDPAWLREKAEEARKELRQKRRRLNVSEDRPRHPGDVWTATISDKTEPSWPILGRAESAEGPEVALLLAIADMHQRQQ